MEPKRPDFSKADVSFEDEMGSILFSLPILLVNVVFIANGFSLRPIQPLMRNNIPIKIAKIRFLFMYLVPRKAF